MNNICESRDCTGCGMCTNICDVAAIEMTKDEHGFYHPSIDSTKCTSCERCYQVCPAQTKSEKIENVLAVYAAWNTDKITRKESTSGGLFSQMAKVIFDDGGVVAGVRWNSAFQAEHFIATSPKQLSFIRGSKYVQSHTGTIYADIQRYLQQGTKVLFSGTPCQNHALKLFLKKDYPDLYQVDLICHGVPSDDILQRYINERIDEKQAEITDIKLRYKTPYWDYCNVKIDYADGGHYVMPTVDDPYFTLFNIGYSLRESCRHCQYTHTHRYGDITLADFWGYTPSSYKMRDYVKGTSCVLINSEKGKSLFGRILNSLVCATSTLDKAKQGNQSLSRPFSPPEESIKNFWIDYDAGMSIADLCAKYVPNRFKKPKLLWLHRLKMRYRWLKLW